VLLWSLLSYFYTDLLLCIAEAFSGTFHVVANITTGYTVRMNFMVIRRLALNIRACDNIIYEGMMHKLPKKWRNVGVYLSSKQHAQETG
jgi:hypothetical protein